MLRRGFLGLAAVALFASVVSAQGQGQRFGGFGAPGGSVGLLGMPEVQKELSVTDEQKKQIDELRDQLQEQQSNARTNFQELQSLSEEERNKRIAEARKNAEEAHKKSDERLGKILDESQMGRLQQLRLQQEGVAAFGREDVAKKLELTDEQKEKIRTIQGQNRPNFSGFGNFQDLSDEERQKLIAEMQQRREKANADILAVLTDAQQEKWSAMKGKEFKFPPRRGFGGFGGGQPGGGERRRPEPKPDQKKDNG